MSIEVEIVVRDAEDLQDIILLVLPAIPRVGDSLMLNNPVRDDRVLRLTVERVTWCNLEKAVGDAIPAQAWVSLECKTDNPESAPH